MSLAVLIPHKNSVDKLRRLLETVPEDCQVIVVDDNSYADQKRTLQHMVETDFSHVQLLHNTGSEHNAGVARNLALDHCDADWIVFADADDKFDEAAFAELKQYLGDSEAEVVLFGCKALHEESQAPSDRCNTYQRLIREWPANRETICYRWMVPWGKAIRKKEVIDANDLRFASRIASNDVEFSADLALVCRSPEVFDRTVYICFESTTSLTASINPVKAVDRLEAAINRSYKFFKRRAPVYYNYNFGFFRTALPLLMKQKRFALCLRYAGSVGISLLMNFKYYLRQKIQ